MLVHRHPPLQEQTLIETLCSLGPEEMERVFSWLTTAEWFDKETGADPRQITVGVKNTARN